MDAAAEPAEVNDVVGSESARIPVLTDVVDLADLPQPTFDLSDLSKRERQVLDLLAAGHGVNEIGRKLVRSCKTISTHKARIRQKLAIKSSVEWMTLLRTMPEAKA